MGTVFICNYPLNLETWRKSCVPVVEMESFLLSVPPFDVHVDLGVNFDLWYDL